MAEIWDNRDGYGGRGDVGRQQKRYGTTKMAKWVGRTATEWANIDREKTTNLRAYHRSDSLGVGETTELHGDLGCIWRLCVSYCNINKITR